LRHLLERNEGGAVRAVSASEDVLAERSAGMLRLTRAISGIGAKRLCLVLGVAAVALFAAAAAAWAQAPQPWQLGMQAPATPVKDRIHSFHNELLVITFLITIFVLGLLLYVIVRFSARRHPIPTKTSHNPLIEILWTVVPVLILVIIAIPSFKLMYYMDRVPNADMTVKITGNQWYWHYDYADQKISFDSNLVEDKDLKPGEPRLLAVDNPLVVPVGATVRAQVTGVPDGVIHSWYVPSFGVQEYAVPGRLNETWFRVEHEGTYYGECNQICGINHSRMPIAIKALAKPDFDKWLAEAKQKFAAAPEVPAGATKLAGN
jgi:cytochrome c oxidase subunit II